MKKIMVILGLVAVCFSAMAQEDRFWLSLFTVAPDTGLPVAAVDGDGFGWWVEAYDVTLDVALAGENLLGNTDKTYGWVTDSGGFLIDAFAYGTVPEGGSVQMWLYNNADKALATLKIGSAVISPLPDLTDPINLGSNEFQFDFTGKTWEAIPEPATMLLFGIGGLGAWLMRRRQQA